MSIKLIKEPQNETQPDEELWDTFTQYAQRCTICFGWLLCDDEIVTDPNHKYHVVHKMCVYIENDDSDDNQTCLIDVNNKRKIEKKEDLFAKITDDSNIKKPKKNTV
jgi:hypothetical protein